MKKTVLFLIAVVLLFSCSSFVYYPNGANAPLLSEKDEIKIAAGIKGFGGDIRSAYAITDKFALQMNVNLVNVETSEPRPFSDEGNEKFQNGNCYAEIAGGYYKSLTPNLIFEAYLGAGRGLSFSESLESGSTRTSNYSKIYLQQDIGLKTKILNAGIALREAYVYVSKVAIDDVDQNLNGYDIFLEPILFLSLGFDKFKINAQAGYSEAQIGSMAYYSPLIFSLGLEYRFLLNKK